MLIDQDFPSKDQGLRTFARGSESSSHEQLVETGLHGVLKICIGPMHLALDAVQNVERDLLTEGYRSKVPLFHKLFLRGVEKWEVKISAIG